ncbi:TPA: hypothetical protein ACN359_002115 [Vibrio parahaemolyticus]|uniref:hypothetical protein n=1 Tax=Vibrio parahaemolyticus TaxID=670 RepID=UPI0008D98D23|nr:hypothetical protein [Vibrio parahaemolyticus]EHK6508532.1 hypothetical protein [Vibrio parahaemolyticus]EID0057171.1 hypothetical protein [Vibrio parahaemolyticus]ELK3867016.1 hypothetical protein [Vibrio parahaemolyticus]ELZ1477449.1 hypothetical protein [Vibrio parahaemolyticus]OHX45648.1 hypothetical protein BB048_01215 [Vibrio parahaemolyticus]
MQTQILLLELRYKDQSTGEVTPVRLTNAPFDVNYLDVPWFAAGDLLDIGETEATYELMTDGVEITLSGVNPVYRQILEQEGFRNAPVDILLATLPKDSDEVSSAKYYHRGYAQNPVTEYQEESDTIAIKFETESVFKNLSKKSMLMTSSLAHHQSFHPEDMFYQYAADTSLGEETWKK